MNKLLIGWRPYALAVVVICALTVVFVVAQQAATGDRFGDPDRIAQINSSTDCGELRRISDDALQTMATNPSDEEFDQAVGYSNAANDRLDELNCR